MRAARREGVERADLQRLVIGVVVALTATVALAAFARATPTDMSDPPDLDLLISVEPMPEDALGSADQLESELAARVVAWGQAIGADDLKPEQMDDAILMIWHKGMSALAEGPMWWIEAKELGARVHFLCVRLPTDDALRSDFCASSGGQTG